MAVQFKFTGDDKDVQRALDNMEKKYNALIATTKKGTDETKKMAAEAKKVFDDTRTPQEQYIKRMEQLNALVKQGAIDQATFGRAANNAGQELRESTEAGGSMVGVAVKAAAAWITVGNALKLVNNEMRNRIELDKKSGDAVKTQAQIREQIYLNLGTATPAQQQAILGKAAQISKARNVPLSSVEAAIPGLTSSQGRLTDPQMMGNLDTAVRAAPNSPETMAAMAMGLNNTARLTGSTDPRENFGFQLGLGRSAQIKSLADINEYMIRAANSVKKYGGTASDAGALVSVLSTGMNDSSGRMSSTASTNVADDLAKFFKRDKSVKSTDDAIHRLQKDSRLRDKFMEEGSFESAAKMPILELLTGGSDMAAMYEQRKGEMPTGAAAVKMAEGYFAGQQRDKILQAAAVDRSMKATAERFHLDNVVEAERSYTREGIQEVLQASGQSGLGNMLDSLGFEIGSLYKDPMDIATEKFGQRRRKILGLGPGTGDADAMANEEAAARSTVGADRTAKADLLQVQIDQLNELKKINRDQRNRNPKQHAE